MRSQDSATFRVSQVGAGETCVRGGERRMTVTRQSVQVQPTVLKIEGAPRVREVIAPPRHMVPWVDNGADDKKR